MSAIIHHFQENRENLRENHKGNYRGSGRPARYRQGNTGGTPVPPIPSAQSTPSVCTYSFALEAFSLIEILVAMAVLAMLMTFMFAMVGGTSRLWERGNAKVEAAQAARVGLNRMADDLQNAMAAQMQSVEPTKTSEIPILTGTDATFKWISWADQVADTDQVFGVRLMGISDNSPYNEFGYGCVFVKKPDGYDTMRSNSFFLVKHQATTIQTSTTFQGGSVSPIIDNCVGFKLQYLGTNNSWLTTWTNKHSLPLGVLVTVKVMDSRTAERISKIQGNPSDLTRSTVPQLLQSGTVEMRRFIPFNNYQHQH